MEKQKPHNPDEKTGERHDAVSDADRQSQIEELIEMAIRHRKSAELAADRLERDGHNLHAEMLELRIKQLQGGKPV